MRWLFLISGVLGVLFFPYPSSAIPDCHLREQASVDMTMTANGNTIIPVTINGHETHFIVGTGDWHSSMNASAAAKLGLTISAYMIQIDTMQIGRLKAEGLNLDERRHNDIGPDAVGVIGADLLSGRDIEIDAKHGKLNFFSPQHCPGQVVYWAHDPYTRIKMNADQYGVVTIPVVLDGKLMTALIDTSSGRSYMDMHDARYYFGWRNDPTELKRAEAFQDNDEYQEYRYPFRKLTFEGVTINNPNIVLFLNRFSGPLNLKQILGPSFVSVVPGLNYSNDAPKISLGMDILRQLHIYIAYGEGYLYATSADAQ